MSRRLVLAAALSVAWSPLAGQLPYLTAPRGTLRIELGGSFGPASEEFADGTRRGFGDPVAASALTASQSPMVADLERQLATLLGTPAGGGSLGALEADLMLQHNVGTIGLAVGITDRLTAFVSLPIVSTRTEATLTPDATSATLGLNPALLGDQSSSQFLEQFQAALDEVAAHRDAGDYAQSAELQALADQVLADGPVFHDALAALLVNGASASPVLPLGDSPDGAALLLAVSGYADRFTNQLGVAAPTVGPALPASAITDSDFGALLTASDAFDLATFDEQPLVGLGDVEMGMTWQLTARQSTEHHAWFGAWITGSVTLPSGTPPRADHLRDAGTGDGQLDLRLGGTVETGRGRLGLRASADWRNQLAGTREARVGGRDEFLLPASRLASLRWDPGNLLTISARPYWRLADRLAIAGSATWFRRGEDRWTLPAGAPAPRFGDVSAMGLGTAASAVRLGIGLSYAHDGSQPDGTRRMPVEAGLALERTATSHSGLVPAALTTRLWFRVYKKLW